MNDQDRAEEFVKGLSGKQNKTPYPKTSSGRVAKVTGANVGPRRTITLSSDTERVVSDPAQKYGRSSKPKS